MKFRFSLLIFSIFLLSCSKEKHKNEKWLTFSVDENLKHNKIFRQMSSENEIQMMIDSEPPLTKRTTKLIYDGSNEYICNPMLWRKSDTVNVNIVYYSGFNSVGFNIAVYENKFDISPFSEDDVINDNDKPSNFKNTKQKLVLNQSKYKLNDSIYGYFEFEKTEHDRFGNSMPHQGKGYFRGKIAQIQ
ncbi:hypothetical protein SAMN02787073_0054 [Chryseobacterium vrystaatense]|uniref:Lipoprotein n=2 Tax=Chryseobacterium vrystaatense TaxID=307480 RepID=A0A1M5PDF5_9FLAO|nr:hypothetical protein SAMN02787073_0054 [Chryseobacterium vrystaatense]